MDCIYAIPVSNMKPIGDVLTFKNEEECADNCAKWKRYVAMMCYRGDMTKYLQDKYSIEYLPVDKECLKSMFGINADDL